MPDVMEIPDAALALADRFLFDEDLTLIDKMGRSARRNAINRDGYPKPRRIGLRSAWLLSEVLSWMRAKPHADPHNKGARKRKALSEGIKHMRAKHGQRVAEADNKNNRRAGDGGPMTDRTSAESGTEMPAKAGVSRSAVSLDHTVTNTEAA